MKKIIILLIAFGVSQISHAVTVSLAGIANGTVGFVTLENPPLTSIPMPSGRAIFVSVSNSLTDVDTAFLPLLASTTTSSATFDTTLASVIAASNPSLSPSSNPGVVRTTNFTLGALASTGNTELGSIGNKTYLFLVAESGGQVKGIGAYTGSAVPSSGAVTFNPLFAGDTLGIGTSVFAAATGTGPTATNASGFQLMAAVPETSTTLLGALGALAMLRRRRR
jgi:hypothetical protein